MIRVAFVLADASDNWLGGINYYRNLFTAVKLLKESSLQPVIFVGSKVSESFANNFNSEEIVRSRIFDPGSLSHFGWKALNKISSGSNILLANLLARHKIDVLSHFDVLPRGSKILTIGWIQDFQHVYLPELFREREITRRNVSFARIARGCDRILMSSESALEDFSNYFPKASVKARLLRFVPEINPGYSNVSLSYLEQKYELSSPYFHLPNQFWAHKNHKVVLYALAKLKEQGLKVPTIVATGKEYDHRHPSHFKDLMAQVHSLGLSDNFWSLGIVPYEDMLALMRYSVAVINPSLFEGWSSTVEEAKALGKAILLSDLPVHREQNPEHGIFFNPTDPDELSRAMMLCLSRSESNKAADCKFDNYAGYLLKRIDFARRYQEIIVELVS